MRIEGMIDCPHTVRCLNRTGIKTMDQLIRYTRNDLLQIRGIGQVIAGNVVNVIAAYKSDPPTQEDKHTQIT